LRCSLYHVVKTEIMQTTTFTIQEKEAVRKYFGVSLEELGEAEFKKKLKSLRAKYHPDNFEKFEDETVREMATERFQTIETLSQKLEHFLGNRAQGVQIAGEDFMSAHALFAIKRLKIEILTSDKDLKYQLFGRFYRWLQYGDTFQIPGTKAAIVMDEGHRGTSIGYQESIRLYLTFGEEDSIEDMVQWLYDRIEGRANKLLVAGNAVDIEPYQMMYAIRQQSFLRLASGK